MITLFNDDDYLVTHANCMDGALCAVIFRRFGGNKDNIRFSSPAHEKVDALVAELAKNLSGKLYLADISISERLALLFDGDVNLEIFDHHKSALSLKKFSWCHIDEKNSMCGSKMFHLICKVRLWNKFVVTDNLFNPLVDAVDDRDRWINENDKSDALSRFFYLVGQDQFIERCLEHPHPSLTKEEKVAVGFDETRRASYIERLKPTIKEVSGHRIGFVNCDRYISEAGHALCDKHNLACCILINTIAVSMRAPASSPLDLSAIAKQYGGGGHRCAAGFPLSALLGKPLIEHITESFELQ